MSEMIVSWKYEIETITGELILEFFECFDSIKLELSYQVFLHAMKNKDPNETLQQKFRLISLIDGRVDFCKFEIEFYKPSKKYKVIRDENEDLI